MENIDSLMLKGFGSQKMEDIGFLPFFLVLLLALLCSMLVSYLYLKFYKNRATGSQIHRAFPLLGVAITTIFICIQFSLPLSLGLLGALSIVRFRTPIKEPEEIGFIMVVIAVSITCATFNILFLTIVLLVTYIGLLLMKHGPRFIKGRLNDGMILVTLPTAEYKTTANDLLNYLETNLPKGKLDSVLEDTEKTVISYSFTQLDKDHFLNLQSELSSMASGIQSNLFFNRIGDV